MIQSYEAYGGKIYDILGFLKRNGADVCGLSSVGPLVYAICDRSSKRALLMALENYNNEIEYREVDPDNKGIQIIKAI
jgi:predicted sugar kinase